MQPLEKPLRNRLEKTIKDARDIAEAAARAALEQWGVAEAQPFTHLSESERELRRKLRIHGRQLGDERNANGLQDISRLVEEVAYEHWHRMLFARFLAENNLLMYPDPDEPVAITLAECDDLAADEGAANGWELAARFAAHMLPQIFRLESPVLQLTLPPEHQQKLERLVIELPLETFSASDSLGWVYQFWQANNKERINKSEVKIGARELPAVTQLFTEPYMVSFLLDNALGAWWAARRLSESDFKYASSEAELRQKAAIPGVPLEYLRFVRISLTPALSQREREPESLSLRERESESPSLREREPESLSLRGREPESPSLRERESESPSLRERESESPSPSGRGVRGEGKKASIPADILKNARALRQNKTNAEQLLWGLLRNRRFANKKFRRQHPLGRYILDFYCHEEQLAIELDGGQHNETSAKYYDTKRTEFINQQGIRVIRFWNNEVLQQTDSVLEALWNTLTPPPLPTGEGLSQPGIRVGDEEFIWQPAAGTFEQWPQQLSELKTLDPCCGSGHFLVAAFLMLVPMRMTLEDLTAREAVDRVLSENLHGLELDQRCVELAAFALALTAWRYPNLPSPSGRGVGGEGPIGYRPLPELHLACSGLSVSVAKEEWKQLGLGKKNLTIALDWLHDTFKDAPVLGSLLNPAKTQAAHLVQWDELSQTLNDALALTPNPSPKGRGEHWLPVPLEEGGDEQHEIGVVAQGLAKAATLLAGQYQWVLTNVPYLARGKQDERLRDFCEQHYPAAKNDLATVFLDRCLELCTYGGTCCIVLPENWLFLSSYKKFRENLLENDNWHLIARLGSGAFNSISGEVVKAVLISISSYHATTKESYILKKSKNKIRGIELSNIDSASEKAIFLKKAEIYSVSQVSQLHNQDARIIFDDRSGSLLLSEFANYNNGLVTGDYPRFGRKYWEINNNNSGWEFQQSTVEDTCMFGGMENIVNWGKGIGELNKFLVERLGLNGTAAWIRGGEAWGRHGICIRGMTSLPVSLYRGHIFDNNITVITPKSTEEYSAIWSYCSSTKYSQNVRKLNSKMSVTDGSFLQVPFDLGYWRDIAVEKYPNGLPKPYTNDPTQWIFHGHPCGSVVWDEETKWTAHGPLRTDETVLQVAVARLLGYRWPAERTLTPTLSLGERESIPPTLSERESMPPTLSERESMPPTLSERESMPPTLSERAFMSPSPFGRGVRGEGGEGGEGEMELADEQREWVKRCEALSLTPALSQREREISLVDDDGIVCIPPVRGEAAASERLLNLLATAYNQHPSPSGRGVGGEGAWSNDILAQLLNNADHAGKTLETWLRDKFFIQHCKLFQHRPFIWHIWDGLRDGFAALVNYHKLDAKLLETLIYTYLGDWIRTQKDAIEKGIDGAEEKLAAAENLKKKLELILAGEAPYDIFVRWKSLDQQAIGWNPDLNDGVRLNIRPFMTVPDVGKRGAGVLRDKPNIKWDKDRGKDMESAPWFHVFNGDRINDHHLTLAEKQAARAKKGAWICSKS